MVGSDHSNNDYNVMIIIHKTLPPVTYGIMLVGPPGLFSPRQAEKRNIFSFHLIGESGATDPCCRDRSLCATRMGETAESWALLLSTCLGSENRGGRDVKLF